MMEYNLLTSSSLADSELGSAPWKMTKEPEGTQELSGKSTSVKIG